MMKSRKILLIATLLAAGFVLRAYLSTLINMGDVLVLAEWSKSLYEQGIKGSYFREGWIYSFPTQPPLMMLTYWLSAWLYEHRYFLAILHNWVKFPPSLILIWLAKNGPLFLIKFWGIMADCLSALLIYLLLVRLKKTSLAIWAMIFLLFNPIPFFVSSIWGQIDILAALFALVAFLMTFDNRKIMLSPVLFALGVMFKPTVLVLAPLYLFWLMRKFLISENKGKWLGGTLLGILLAMSIALVSFIPFWDRTETFSGHINSVMTKRVLPSAKGVSKVATSAFTFFTLLFDIDKTPGSHKIAFFTLDQIGNLFFILIICSLSLFMLSLKKKGTLPQEWRNLCFLAYFSAEGIFLFKTNMAERYFLPGFLFLFLAYFLVEPRKIKLAIIFQFLVWLVNLASSFFMRDSYFLQTFFRGQNYWGTRIFSFFNLAVYFYLIFQLRESWWPAKLRLLPKWRGTNNQH